MAARLPAFPRGTHPMHSAAPNLVQTRFSGTDSAGFFNLALDPPSRFPLGRSLDLHMNARVVTCDDESIFARPTMISRASNARESFLQRSDAITTYRNARDDQPGAYAVVRQTTLL